MNNNMTMTYELITPEIAQEWLDCNPNNRKLSEGTVKAYANDILAHNWDERVGVAISIDENGVLRDGQHRLAAIVLSGIPIRSWVCRGVASDGIYDNNRKRTASDQISIMREDLEGVYHSHRYISVARAMIQHMGNRHTMRAVTVKEILDYTDAHKAELDGYFLNVNQGSVAKLSIAPVHVSLYLAYLGGVDIEDIIDFYDVLCTGMSSSEQEFPIIAYRNYLLNVVGSIHSTDAEIARCQYSLKKYLTKSCTKKTVSPNKLFWDFPS